MKQVMVGIFAHPDDESFGPSGTLLKMVQDEVDIHLLLITDGEAGMNPTNAPDLGALRLEEWSRGTELIGATSTEALHFPDGQLSHSMHIAIGAALHAEMHRIIESYAEPIELSIMTYDLLGLTGHLDHIAAGYLATHQFYSLKYDTPNNVTVSELWYFCLSQDQVPNQEWTDYYMPIGRDKTFINREINVSDFLDRKFAVMDAHASQAIDATTQKQLGTELLAREHFHVVT
ncbi:PIG-L family deacetylase [Candidatus Saccharibacteria bacterium]|nr:PIG-L family deacetylase [Candidatus Saccharibacteria bacterium]